MRTKDVWYWIMGWKRICSGCKKAFYCSGNCPPNRWGDCAPLSMNEYARTHNDYCFCPHCITQAKHFPSEEKRGRQKYCWDRR